MSIGRLLGIALACVATALTSSACASAEVSEKHYFAAYGPSGETNFYRVDIEATSRNARTEFRSGTYPADAVDAVFGDVTREGDPQAKIQVLRTALYNAAKRYADTISDPAKTDEEVEKARVTYSRARDGLRQVLSEKEFELEMKFVFVFSTNPSNVIKAIKQQLKGEKFGRSLARLVHQDLLEDAAVAKEELGQVERARARAAAATAAVTEAASGVTVPTNASEVDAIRVFRSALRRLSTSADSLEAGLRR